MTSHRIVDVKNLNVMFQGKVVLSSLSFSIYKGERVAIIGPSGAGKSTLLNILSLSHHTYSGELFINGKSPSAINHRKVRAKQIGLMRQQFDLVESLPVIHNVLVGRLADWGFLKSLLSLVYPQDKDTALYALSRVGLRDKWQVRTSLLSGGEKQRVALARLLIQHPEIILADEPVASLDPARAESVLQTLTKLVVEEDQTLITVLHSVEYAKKYFTRVIGIRDGQIQFDLPSNQVNDATLKSLYRFEEREN